MSRETSEATGKADGLARVCQVLKFPRSTIYAQQARETAPVPPLHPERRGPKPKVSDVDLLVAIRAGVWVFSAVDHLDACCVGIHAVKIGNRFAAMQPISQGLQAEFGTTGALADKGLKRRMDHGAIHG